MEKINYEKGSKKQLLLEMIRRLPDGISFGAYYRKAQGIGLNDGNANYYLKEYREKGQVILFDEHILIKPVFT